MPKTQKILLKGLLLIVLYSLALNLPFLWEREFQGEAARRAVAALEMMERGDYLIPYIEGRPYLLKPPGYNWVLIGFFKLFGSPSEFVARLSSVTAATLCALFLALLFRAISRAPGLLWVLPGLIFLSIPEVLDKACRAEIDMTYTLLVTLSVFSWFYLHEIRKRPYLAWTLALGFSALATLTKTFQAPAFLYAAVGPYLLFKRRFREIFSPAHLLGLFVYAGIFSLWFVPAARRVGAERILSAWFGEYAGRQKPLSPSGFWGHFLTFPWEYFEGHLPWILFLMGWLSRTLREDLPSSLKDLSLYSLSLLAFSFPLYWILPGTRLRYLLPAVGGLVYLLSVPLYRGWERNWLPRLSFLALRLLSGLILIALPLFAYASWGRLHLKGNLWALVGFLMVTLSGLLVLFSRRARSLFLALFFFVWALKYTFAAVYFPYQEHFRNHYSRAARELASHLPPGTLLCDYRLDSPHLTYYLKYKYHHIRHMRLIKDAQALKECRYIITTPQKLKDLPFKFKILIKTKARKTPVVLIETYGPIGSQ